MGRFLLILRQDMGTFEVNFTRVMENVEVLFKHAIRRCGGDFWTVKVVEQCFQTGHWSAHHTFRPP